MSKLEKKNINRIETLDWLRGLMAISIMLYHLWSWIYYPLNSSSTLGRFGIYGVAIFFVLSGLSMAIVYNNYFVSIKKAINFFIRRIFRIWPLLWIACILVAIPEVINNNGYDWKLFLINITTLFGFISPSKYMVIGAWSIGNEIVYYALTPFIILLYNKNKFYGNIILMLSVITGLLFAFYYLDSEIKLENQWHIYVNPLNNLFLYISGIGIYYNYTSFSINSNWNYLLLIVSLTFFCFLPFNGDQIEIVTGFGRVIFTTLSILVVFCFYKLKVNYYSVFKKMLENIGIATYGIYLIHPFIYRYL